jgi:hypothetical protein
LSFFLFQSSFISILIIIRKRTVLISCLNSPAAPNFPRNAVSLRPCSLLIGWARVHLRSLGSARSPSNTHTTTPTARKMNSQSGARGPSDAERAAMSFDHRSQVRFVRDDNNASPGPNTSLWSRIKAKAPKIGSKSAVSQPRFSACQTHHVPVHCLHYDATRQHTQLAFVGMCAAIAQRGASWGDVRRRLCHTGHSNRIHVIFTHGQLLCDTIGLCPMRLRCVWVVTFHCWCFAWVVDPATR